MFIRISEYEVGERSDVQNHTLYHLSRGIVGYRRSPVVELCSETCDVARTTAVAINVVHVEKGCCEWVLGIYAGVLGKL